LHNHATTIIRNEALKINAPIDPFSLIELYTLLKPLIGLDPETARSIRDLEYMSVVEYLASSFKRLGVEEPESTAEELIGRVLNRCLKECSEKKGDF